MIKRILLTISLILLTPVAVTATPRGNTLKQDWSLKAKAMWPTFQKRPDLIDLCARAIATGAAFNTNSTAPWYCVPFRTTDLVRSRAAQMEHALAAIKDPATESKVLAGQVWIGATPEQMELSWGRPTLSKTRGDAKIWMYDSCLCYILFRRGRVAEYNFYR